MAGKARDVARIIQVLNGPNLNMLGTRETSIYGTATLADVEKLCRERAGKLGFEIAFHQSNHEGVLVDWIQAARDTAAAIVINPGAYTHTSVAIMDALQAFAGPIVEVHISNIHRREEFRRHSFVSKVATGVICGLGIGGYALAVEAVTEILAAKNG